MAHAEAREAPEALPCPADDGGGLSIPGLPLEFAQCLQDGPVIRAVHRHHVPAEGFEPAFHAVHGKGHCPRIVQLSSVQVDQETEVVEFFASREHHRFPDHPRLELSVSGQAEHVEPGLFLPGQGKALGDAEPMPFRPCRDMDTGKQGAGMAVQDAFLRTGVFQYAPVEVAEIRVDRSQGGDGMALAENEHVLPDLGRFLHRIPHDAAVVQGHQRNDGGKGPADVDAPVDRVPPLFKAQDPDVGVFYPQQGENTFIHDLSFHCASFPAFPGRHSWSPPAPERRYPRYPRKQGVPEREELSYREGRE